MDEAPESCRFILEIQKPNTIEKLRSIFKIGIARDFNPEWIIEEAGESRVEITVDASFFMPEYGVQRMIYEILKRIAPVGGVRLVDVIPSREALSSFDGPCYGVDGISKILGYTGPPIAVQISDWEGSIPSHILKLFYEIASQGVDIGIDCTVDPFKFQAMAEMSIDYINRVKSETGRKVLFAVNLPSNPTKMVKYAEEAASIGATAVKVSGGLEILDVVFNISKLKVKIPLLADFSGYSYIFKVVSPMVIVKLARLSGADIIFLERDTLETVGERDYKLCLEAVQVENGLKKSYLAIDGPMNPSMVEYLLKTYERYIVLSTSEAVFNHPDGYGSGAKALRQAVDAVLRGESVFEAADAHDELRQAIEAWERRGL